MLVALELTARQAARMLAEAVQNHAKLEIDPRPEYLETPLWGALDNRRQDLLLVNVLGVGQKVQLAGLVGAMCDVRTIVSGQLYMFATVIVEASENTAPPRISLAVPESIQVANRRRFARKSPAEPIPVRIFPADTAQPLVADLSSISRGGLACRMRQQAADERLLIGDEARVEFALPWLHQVYALPVTVCTKTVCHDREHVIVGLEYVTSDAAARATLELLRTALDNETQRLTDLEGLA